VWRAQAANVLIGEDGQVRLADFGVACALRRDSDNATLHHVCDQSHAAARSTPIGTPVFMAPEVSHILQMLLPGLLLGVLTPTRAPISADMPSHALLSCKQIKSDGLAPSIPRSSMRAAPRAVKLTMSGPTPGRSVFSCWSCAVAVRLMQRARSKLRLCRLSTIRRRS